uniref:Uncharacterized protein n=1 Tax=Panagrolaimus sp. ES5 TaxID=591445 RepID=A0AC34G2H4_9BILA
MTQDVPNESAAPATTQTPTKLIQRREEKPPQNEKPKELIRKKRPADPTTITKEITTPLLTDFLNKKVEKENFEELSRTPVVRTANIKREKFPYSNQDHQDTMAGISSNFSGTIEVPPPEAHIPDAEQEAKNKQQRISSFSSK